MHSFAIIPAAGRGQRMGRPKLLLPWGGSTVIQSVLAAWRSSCVTQMVAVVRPEDQELAEICRAAGADVVRPDAPPPEMKVSVRLALTHVQRHYRPRSSDVWLLAPGDMPRLSPRVIDRLLEEFDAAAGEILVPTADGRRGHPVLFPWALACRVHDLAAGEGVNQLLERHPVRSIPVQDRTILDDLDTPDDYRRLNHPHK